MRRTNYTARFRKDYRKVLRGRYGANLVRDLASVIPLLETDEPLAVARRDHSLTGKYSDYRECHVRPDLLLIYSKPDDDTLQLDRLGTHSEVFK